MNENFVLTKDCAIFAWTFRRGFPNSFMDVAPQGTIHSNI